MKAEHLDDFVCGVHGRGFVRARVVGKYHILFIKNELDRDQ